MLTLDLRAHRAIPARAGEERQLTGSGRDLGDAERGEAAPAESFALDAAPSGLPGAGA